MDEDRRRDVLKRLSYIEGAVGEMEGVRTVSVDIPAKTVHIEYDPQQVTLAKIEEIMDDVGYTVAK
jgi:copper chaperone